MKIRKIALSMLVLALAGGATVGASEAIQTWQGKKVQVEVNGAKLEGGGINIDGKTYLPLRSLSGIIQGMIRGDSTSVHIYKPNVHLLLFTGDKNAMKPFGNVYQGSYEFFVFAQVDNLKTNAHSIMTEVVDPFGQKVDSQVYQLSSDIKDMFWYTTSAFKINFTATGEYKVKFYIKQTESHDFELLSEKAIISMKKD